MTSSIEQFGITAFTMILIVVNPVGIAPIFIAVTQDMSSEDRASVLRRAVLTAFCVASFFLFLGPTLLSYLGVTLHAFGISGGILLFMLSLPMLFGQSKSPHPVTAAEFKSSADDVAIFPLGIPHLVGPGTIATILVLKSEADRDPLRMAVIGAAIVTVYVVSWFILLTAESITKRLGQGLIQILTRVLGILLAALAVQYVLNGIRGFKASL